MNKRTVALGMCLGLGIGVAALATGCDPAPKCGDIPALTGYPTMTAGPNKVGLPEGWTPTETINGSLFAETEGQTFTNVHVLGDVEVKAKNITLCNVQVDGRVWTQHGQATEPGLKQDSVQIEHSEIGTLDPNSASEHGAVGPGQYVVLNSVIHGWDGLRQSAPEVGWEGHNNVFVKDSYIHEDLPCPPDGLHGDGSQGFGASDNIQIIHNTFDVQGGCVAGDAVNAALFTADNGGNTNPAPSMVAKNNLFLGDQAFTIKLHDDTGLDFINGQWIPNGHGLMKATVTDNVIVNAMSGAADNVGLSCNNPDLVTWTNNTRYASVTLTDGVYTFNNQLADVAC